MILPRFVAMVGAAYWHSHPPRVKVMRTLMTTDENTYDHRCELYALIDLIYYDDGLELGSD